MNRTNPSASAGHYPPARRESTADEIHGRIVPDPYRWLEDPADPHTAAWLQAQQRLYEQVSEPSDGALRGRLARLTRIDAVSLPKHRGGRVFFSVLTPGAERPALYASHGGEVRTLFDPAVFDPSGRTALDAFEPSWDGTRVTVQVSEGGTEESQLFVLDTVSGDVLDGPIDRVRRSSVAWLPGAAAFYYVRRRPPAEHPGEEKYHRRVCLHRVGADPDGDAVVFGEGRGATQFYSLSITPDGRLLSVRASAGTGGAADLYLADLGVSAQAGEDADTAAALGLDAVLEQPEFVPVQEDADARISLRFPPGGCASGTVHLITDRGAPRGRIVAANVAAPIAEHWRELIPQDPEAVVVDAALLGGPLLPRPLLVVLKTRHAVSELSVHDAEDGTRLSDVPLPGAGTVGALRTRAEGGHEVWFTYTDYVTAPTVLCYDAAAGQVVPWRVPGADTEAASAPTADVKTLQVICESADGTPVRMFLICAAGVPDGPRAAILAGYGGFGSSQAPAYSPAALAWAQAGGVFAVACVRGGGEEGEAWHRAGKGLNKTKSFEDFEAAADWLVAEGWTVPDRLGLMGRSNGGLLVGAALTRRPEAYAAVVCMAPLLDMVRYERSGLGPSWREEYGSAADPAQFENLLSYSPYHRVREGERYPAVLFAVFDGDTRVDPAHARKMCAALQHASAGSGPILLRAEKGAGHGAREVSRTVALFGDALGFLARRLGLESGDTAAPRAVPAVRGREPV